MELQEVPILVIENFSEIEMPRASGEVDEPHIPCQSPCGCLCAFSNHESNKSDVQQRAESKMKLVGLIFLYLFFMAIEVFGGLKSNSLAVLSDAAHLLTDIAGLTISLFGIWASGWKATSNYSFGFSRLEVLGALLSVQLVWLISGVLIFEAVNRLLVKDAPVNGKIMFAVAVFGFLTNLIMVLWLHHDHSHHGCGHGLHGDHGHAHHGCGHGDQGNDNHGEEESTSTAEEKINLISSSPDNGKTSNINLQAAYLHVLADMIQSMGVIIAGAIIWAKPDWLVVDLICTLIFSTFAVSTTITMLRSIFGILMERTPGTIDISNLETSLKSIKGVHDVHDLHVWSVTMGKVAMACHVKAEAGVSSRDILLKIRDFCEKTYRINHVTIQIEEERG